MPPDFAQKVPKDLADKFDEVVAGGPPDSGVPFGPVWPTASGLQPAAAAPPDAAMAPLQEAFEELREDVRQGLAAASQVQFDAMVPVRAALEKLVEQVAEARAQPQEPPLDLPVDALRDEMRHLLSQLNTAPAVTVPPELSGLRGTLEAMRQEMQRDRGHRDALRASVLEAVGAARNEMQSVRDLLALAAKDETSRHADAKATAEGLASVRDALAELRGMEERDRSAVGGVHQDVVRSIDAFCRELGEQLRERDGREADIEMLVAGLDSGLTAARQSITDAGNVNLNVLRAIEAVRRDLGELRDGPSGRRGEVDTAALAAGLDSGLKDVRQALGELRIEDEQAREAAAEARRELMRTLEAFHDELVEQWRERKAFEAAVPPVLEGLRLALTDGMAKLSAGIGLLPAAMASDTAVPTELEAIRVALADAVATLSAGIGFLPAAISDQFPVRDELAAALTAAVAAATPPAPDPAAPDRHEDVLSEVAALRGELVDQAGQLDDFLRTAVSGANRWFVKMRDDLYQRIDEFGEASANGWASSANGEASANGEVSSADDGRGHDRLFAAIEALRADVQGLHDYLAIVDTNLQRFHDALAGSGQPHAIRRAPVRSTPIDGSPG